MKQFVLCNPIKVFLWLIFQIETLTKAKLVLLGRFETLFKKKESKEKSDHKF